MQDQPATLPPYAFRRRYMMGWILVMSIPCTAAGSGPARFRKPAPLEDDGPQIPTPTFGRCAGHVETDRYLHVKEWVAKRTWHVLGLPYERADRQGPPAMFVQPGPNGVEITGTVAIGGVPLRNQVISATVEQRDAPLLVLLRSTDAFGEVLVELDLHAGRALARTVTVSRSMIGGQSHSSPMPEESASWIVRGDRFPPQEHGPVALRIRTQGQRVVVWVNENEIFRFHDSDPAGGSFGFGSTGTMLVRDVEQWELITAEEQQRRQACLEEMHELCKDLDADYDNDVRRLNQVTADQEAVRWRWPATGATAQFLVEGPYVYGRVGAGLYGNDPLIDGLFPEVTVVAEDGRLFTADADREARLTADDLGVSMVLPLRDLSGHPAAAHVRIKFTVQTVWFWTIHIEGIAPRSVQAFLSPAQTFAPDQSGSQEDEIPQVAAGSWRSHACYVKHNAKAGFFTKALFPETTRLGIRRGARDLAWSAQGASLRFATVFLPAQPLNKVGFSKRMVHYIRYSEGPNQRWRRRPGFQEYPTDVDLARFAANGTNGMVWHHTWIGDDYRDREGFLVNEAEMRRAMDETHRLGMVTIGYIGIVPGRSALLRLEDTCPITGGETYGIYDKNWDLQDFTFLHCAGRAQEFLPWMADFWCREYGLDGFYLDGGGLGYLSRGGMKEPLHPEDADLSLEEIRHRLYYRVKKVFERNQAGFGLEPWGGLDWMLNGFYDCMMIGESFQEAPPESYRDTNNALLTGCCIKMYGMRESSQNPYNVAMAAVCLSDIQVCSGNGAWGDLPDTTETWSRVRPLWDILDRIDWDRLVDARPWYAQELVQGEGFYAGNYTEPDRVLIFLANRSEEPGRFEVKIDTARLPEAKGTWHARYVLGQTGDIGPLGDGCLHVPLPALHDGPVGIELVAK